MRNRGTLPVASHCISWPRPNSPMTQPLPKSVPSQPLTALLSTTRARVNAAPLLAMKSPAPVVSATPVPAARWARFMARRPACAAAAGSEDEIVGIKDRRYVGCGRGDVIAEVCRVRLDGVNATRAVGASTFEIAAPTAGDVGGIEIEVPAHCADSGGAPAKVVRVPCRPNNSDLAVVALKCPRRNAGAVGVCGEPIGRRTALSGNRPVRGIEAHREIVERGRWALHVAVAARGMRS